MLDTRHKNCKWALPTSDEGCVKDWQYVPIAILMDIRDELQKLNTLLACPNFPGIPQTLRDIKRATNRIPTIARPRKPKVKK